MPLYLPTDSGETTAQTSVAAVMPLTTTTIFTVSGVGPLMVMQLVALSTSANNTNAATLQWTYDGTLGTATTLSAASTSLASLAAGDMLVWSGAALNTVPTIIATGTSAGLLFETTTNGVILNGPGVMRIIIGTAATTGTWNHYMRWRPLARGIVITPAF